MKKKVWKYILGALLLVIIGVLVYKWKSGKSVVVELQTSRIGKATICNTVMATGTLETSVAVEVGTQVSGRIEKVTVDYNSRVKKGQLLAIIDTEALESTLASSKASLDMAQADFEFQNANYERNKKLIEKQLIAQRDFDEVEYSFKSAQANLDAAEAKYNKDKTNLNYAYIYSPIDGIVLEKNVEEGETVAASFNTPTLFTIANDLTRMEIEADVDEADIGQVKQGQRVEFTVDAFPDLTFDGEVREIHLMPTESANVITYTVIIGASNPDELLMPGMTANLTFYVMEKEDVLAIPNRAVEFMPDQSLLDAYQEAHPGVTIEKLDRRPGFAPTAGRDPGMSLGARRIVWVKEKDRIYPTEVELGQTDEINYELVSGLTEGTEVITAIVAENIEEEKPGEGGSQSPFMPKPPGANRKK
ncbi:MAG: efflux RND transporter periplasmic adaptor subunit [Bacteroidales bacterium]|nr:efflux RND transporter periplasmic adaptor subunit [Bacteroidales bacterium]